MSQSNPQRGDVFQLGPTDPDLPWNEQPHPLAYVIGPIDSEMNVPAVVNNELTVFSFVDLDCEYRGNVTEKDLQTMERRAKVG